MIFTAIYNGHRVRILRYQHVGNNCHSLCETNRFCKKKMAKQKQAAGGKSEETKKKNTLTQESFSSATLSYKGGKKSGTF